MPSLSLGAGETTELLSGDPGDTVFMRADGDVRVSKRKQFARDGRDIPADEPAEIRFKEQNEALHVHAVEAATVDFELQGFELSLFGREIVRIDGNETVGQVASDTQRISAESVVEINADQTTNLAPGESQTTIVQADAGEVWELNKIRLYADKLGAIQNTKSESHLFTVTTEKEGIAVANAHMTEDLRISYNYGAWQGSEYFSTKDDLSDIYIDDTNGLSITYENRNTDDTQNGNRTIRLSFNVTKT